MASKLSPTIYFVFTCLIIGTCGSAIQQEFWSARAFAETSLIVCSLLYLSSKYYSGKIIQKYQDYNFTPGKRKRFFDDIIVESSFHILMPISVSILYASCFLVVLKCLPTQSYSVISNLVNPIIDFNSNYLKYPIVLLITILSILTLTRYLSLTKFKLFKKVSKYIASPFKVLVTISFFLSQDMGIRGNMLEYHFNSKPVVSEFVTLNASTQENNKKDGEIKQALNEYVKYVIERLDHSYKNEVNEDSNRITILPNAVKIRSLVHEYPQIEKKVAENIRLTQSYRIGNNEKTYEEYHKTVWSYNEDKAKTSNLYNVARKKESSFFTDFISTLADERTSIRNVALTEDGEIIQKLMGDFWGEIFPFEKLTASIPLHSIIKDKAVDLLNDKLINSFYTLLSTKKVSKSDIAKLNSYIDNVLAKNYKSCVKSVRNKFKLFTAYYSELTKTATASYFDKLTKYPDRSIITYEDGLLKRKTYIAKIREKWLSDLDMEKNMDELKKTYPDRTDQEIQVALERWKAETLAEFDFKILEIDAALSDKENLKNYEYIRDRFSAGGIFFGRPISTYSPDACTTDFYPQITNCPNAILKEKILSLEVANGKIIITSISGRFSNRSDFSMRLLLDAYNYVYSSSSFPVLIDGFYDDNRKEMFAYNKNIVYDKDFLASLFSSDKFIFDVLHNNIPDADLKMRFRDAVSAYDRYQKEVSLSRIYDDGYYITVAEKRKFEINSQLRFSVVSKNSKTSQTSEKYKEIYTISAQFNSNRNWLLNRYQYLNDLAKFASYQALFRSLDQNKVDISDLILEK